METNPVTLTATAGQGIRLHRKQFVIGPAPKPMHDDWLSSEVAPGVWLSRCPDLRYIDSTDARGQRWQLLGLASQTRTDRPAPAAELATTDTAGVAAAYEGWAGRWALIGGGELHLDAAAQLGCYSTVCPDGGAWASSSPAIIAELPGIGPERLLEPTYERGLSWIAPPLGRRRGIRRLLASEILDLRRGSTRWRRLVTPSDELGDGDLLMRFGEALGQAMAGLPDGVPKSLALTAGADSRLVLAAALAADIDLDLFTRQASRMSLADRVVPPKLAAAVGLTHRLVLPKQPAPSRRGLAQAHTDRQVSDGDALPFIEGVRDDFIGIEIGGQGFGAGKVKNRDLPADIGQPAITAAALADRFGEPFESANREALADWLGMVADQHRTQPPEQRVDWRDRFYLEQRMAGWQSPKEQLYDLYGHQRFFPINSARTFGLLLAVDEQRRCGGAHQRELIGMLDDRLLGQPFNPPGKTYGTARRIGHLLLVDRSGMPGRLLEKLRTVRPV